MASLINTVSTAAGFTMKSSMKQISKASGQIATGFKGPSEVVDYVTGSKLRSNAEILISVAKGVTYGSNLLKTAELILISVKEKLTNLKKIIAQSDTATGESLTRLDILFEDGVKDILRQLGSATFDNRKLFDGTLAVPGGIVREQNMPKQGTGPLKIKVGENTANTISVTIPRLLGGVGEYKDIEVEGRFTPIFPINETVADAASLICGNYKTGMPLINNLMKIFDRVSLPGNSNAVKRILTVSKAAFESAKTKAAIGNTKTNSELNRLGSSAAHRAARAHAQFISPGSNLDIDNKVSNALTTITKQIMLIGSQMQHLHQAMNDISMLIKVQNEAADNYLKTNYEEATKKFKTALLSTRGCISIIRQGYLIPEAVLELVTE